MTPDDVMALVIAAVAVWALLEARERALAAWPFLDAGERMVWVGRLLLVLAVGVGGVGRAYDWLPWLWRPFLLLALLLLALGWRHERTARRHGARRRA